MLFSSTTFIYLFLPIVLFFYHVVFRKNRKRQNIFLLISSLFFYAWGEPKFVLVMAASIIINWAIGLWVHYNREHPACKWVLALDVVLNLGLLFVFKYLNFTGSILNYFLDGQLQLPKIALPIGISFFTFQAMSYVLDVYREKGQVQKDILSVGLYVSFFPQLIAGPIVRYETVADEIWNRQETSDDFYDGFARFIVGLAKKVLLSNSFALLADKAFDAVGAGNQISVAFSWLGALAYTMQIFFDFGGYSDMAIGLGKMFGFHFLENFNYPYISTSVSEFWRRWHISLGTWFRDYLYFPLGGSRVKKGRMVLNLFAVWSLTGLWHGANFTFITWGLLYFVLLTAEKLTGLEKIGQKSRGITAVKWLYTMFFVVLGWVLFRAESMQIALRYMEGMFGVCGNVLWDEVALAALRSNVVLMTVGGVLCTPVFRLLKQRIRPNAFFDVVHVLVLVSLLIVSVASLVSSSYNPFIYFNF